MNKFVLFTLLIICGSVFAEDCTTLTTQATCTANTGCTYTATGGKCDNKCTGLVKADCENVTNSPNCDSNAEKCDIALSCNTLKDKKTDCQGNKACTWVDAVVGTCDFKSKVTTSTDCGAKNGDKATCEANGICSFTAASFKSCDYQSGVCSSKTTAAACDPNYCTRNDTVCEATSPANCAAMSQSECQAASQTCSYVGSACVEICATYTEDTTCTNNSLCKVKSSFSCASNQSAGQTQCQTTDTDTDCVSTFCKKTLNPATCKIVDTYCSDKTATNCGNDTTTCQIVGNSPSECNNNATSAQCTALTAKTDCDGNTGCSWFAYSCSNKTAKSCQATDKEADCTVATKFCTYTPSGTCEANSNSYLLSALGSLLVTLILL